MFFSFHKFTGLNIDIITIMYYHKLKALKRRDNVEKSTLKFLSVLLCLAMLLSLPIISNAKQKSEVAFSGTYTHSQCARNTLLSRRSIPTFRNYVYDSEYYPDVKDYEYYPDVKDYEYYPDVHDYEYTPVIKDIDIITDAVPSSIPNDISIGTTTKDGKKQKTKKKHIWKRKKVNKKATAKKTGTKTLICSVCGKTKKVSIPKNKFSVKGKKLTVKRKNVRRKSRYYSVKKYLSIKNSKGKLGYRKLRGPKKITINKKTGKLKIKKGLRKGLYTVKVKVSAKGNSQYKPSSKTVTFKIRVK